ncbi:hypothetical protein HK11_09530 [Acetobacter sp. DmW_043]|uniref:DUF4123 domain-containing protein n=1 Tax=Acetobacter sp. DmW_043 TaxID=1670658 RepID=UPI000A3C827A|nr:DUF4123 domain-containing protein [Acetobacter sp. DmW_043]OUI89570.1 hypothetical protein HK11_09530 [Acetobacter sp. DmW_043]
MSDLLSDLKNRLAEWLTTGTVFAVIEGAAYPDCPALLKAHGLIYGSLFREPCDPDILRTGPFLIQAEQKKLDNLLSIPGIIRNAIFWHTSEISGHVFWSHLRKLTKVSIPSSLDDGSGQKMRTAMFRFQDPWVTERIFPIFTPAQRARFFGPANALLIAVPDGVKIVRRNLRWPAPQPGVLTLSPEQTTQLENARYEQNIRRFITYLRASWPDKTASVTDVEMHTLVEEEIRHGASWGLTTTPCLIFFCRSVIVGDTAFMKDEAFKKYIMHGDESTSHMTPDERLVKSIRDAARHDLQKELEK